MSEQDSPRAAPLFSVIVPCLGHAPELAGCLRGLRAQATGFAYEVIVVDSASDPDVAGVVAAAATDWPGLRLIRPETGETLAPSAARDLGVAHAAGRCLAFTDADCVPEPQWLAAARESLAGGARVTGGPVLNLHPWHPVAAIDNALQFADFAAGRPDGPARYFPGANFAISRRDLQALGGLPAGVKRRAGDAVFSTQARERWPGGLRYKQQMRVRHHGRQTLGAMWRHQWQFGYVRARSRIQLKPIHWRLGRRAPFIPLVMGRRLSYIAGRAVRWDRAGLLRLLLFWPVLLAGLLAWALGFYRGLNDPEGAS